MRDPSHEPNYRVLSNLAWFEKRALWLVAIVAGGVLILWFAPAAAVFAPAGWSRMKAATAVGILLATCSLALSAPPSSERALQGSRAAAFATLALGSIVLLRYACGITLGIETWVQLPSPQTALGFALAGVCLALIRQSKSTLSTVADICAVALVALVLFLVGGYAFGVIEMIGLDHANLTSPHTLICLGLLAFMVAARRAVEGVLLSIVVNRGIGSRIARTVLPGILVLPFIVFVAVGYLDESEIVPARYTRAVAAPLVALVTLAIVAWMGRRTNDLERRLRLQSLTDPLTGIYNRRGFHALAERTMWDAMRAKTGLVVLCFDLDGLKRVNDTLGHEAGSQLIKGFANALAGTFRKNDVVGRLGGDEFAVVVATTDTAAEMLARLDHIVAATNAAGSVPGPIAYSAGYVELAPGVEGKIEDLIAQADVMMYEQKFRKKAA
jgi:diguanylate cyclase (GGDEF)-like protein